MNKNTKMSLLFALAFIMFSIIGIANNSVYALTSRIVMPSDYSHNLFEFSYNNTTDHSINKYYLSTDNSRRVYCVQPESPFASGILYDEAEAPELDQDQLVKVSYIILSNPTSNEEKNEQIRQTAIWKIVAPGGDIILKEATENDKKIVDNLINEANSLYSGGKIVVGDAAGEAKFVGDFKFNFDNAMDAYVSTEVTLNVSRGNANLKLEEAPSGSYMLINGSRAGNGEYGNGTKIKVVVPKDSFSNEANVTLNATTPDTTQTVYKPATEYHVRTETKYTQWVASANVGTEPSKGRSIPLSGKVRQTYLKVMKKDEHGNAIAGCKFHITGPNGFDKEVTTEDDGTATIKGVQPGDYTITEIYVTGNLYIDSNSATKKVTVKDSNSGNNNTTEFTQINKYVRGEAKIKKELVPPQENGWIGDANYSGIQYTLYAAEDIYEGNTKIYSNGAEVGVVTFDKDGSEKTISNLPIGNYTWKETKVNETVEEDENQPYSVTIAKSSDMYSSKAVEVPTTPAKDKVKKYNIQIIKFLEQDSTDEQPAKGAVLRLTLNSDSTQTYTAVVDENGHASFENIPWGEYTLSEDTTNSNYHLEIQNKAITLKDSNPNMKNENNVETTYKIIGDKKVKLYLKAIKKDKDIKKQVALPGTKFKIYSIADKKFVTLLVDNHWIDEFETDEDGVFITPQQLTAGDYRIYETQAPEGYYLNPELAIPTDSSKVGTEGGKLVTVDKFTEVVVLEQERGLMHTEELEDNPLKGRIKIYKQGEMATGVNQTTEKDVNGEDVTVNTPTYEYKGLANVTFEIWTAEDIKTPDKRFTYPGYEKGKLVDTITTDSTGYATTKDLYCGKYIIKETKTPYGYIPEEDQEVDVENNNQTVLVEEINKTIKNKKQPVNVSMEKLFDVGNYEVTLDSAKASLGIYTNHDIKDSTGKVIIRKDSLVGLANCELTKEQMEEGEKAKINEIVNIPEGDYYVKEIATTQPFEIDDEEHPFTVKFDDNDDEPYNVTLSDTIVNIYPQVETLRVYKISDSSLINAANGVFTGTSVEDITTLDESELSEADKANKKVIEDKIEKYTKYSSKEEAEEELKKDNINLLAGAQYKVYLDKECTKPLHRTVDGVREEVTLVTNENGYAEMNNVPKGKYYLKEVVAPKYKDSEGKVISYDVAKNPVEIELTDEHVKNRLALRIASDSLGEGDTFKKTDIFTGETIPNCTFEILDENKNVLLHTTTDNNGTGYIPYDILENGKTYYLKEISAPGIYDINEELHDFVASYEVTEDGKVNWTGEKIKVNNRRKEGKLTVIKTDRETGKRLQGCVFSIALLDENGNIAKNAETGEEIYLVKNAVTDENGEYVNENVPYGTYKFIEVTPPEGYEIDNVEDILNATFTIGDDSKEVIFEVTNTGDIAVIALSIVAVVSVAGIVYVALKNKKKNA